MLTGTIGRDCDVRVRKPAKEGGVVSTFDIISVINSDTVFNSQKLESSCAAR